MKVEIFYEAPDSQVLELDEDQAELWDTYAKARQAATDSRIAVGWTGETWKLFSAADDAYDTFLESVAFELDYSDLDIEEVQEW